ncbi:PQQ-binding-like beta-propeller repeat protein [uncultured Tenacibaculum sp.]|uniref:PQQ-binding-like beta-propeller repeat protein n=1 Tax=uncultured Tenacibaculum sp. TaxID=174713 RepID=UPI0026298142|nr:PQQ-binding-like beta-propeller repeat protein [uncultured Tenacibaculum sp.]
MNYKYLLVLLFLFFSSCIYNTTEKIKNTIKTIIAVENKFHYYENNDGYIVKKNSQTKKVVWKHQKLYQLSLKVLNSKNNIYYTTPNKVISLDKMTGAINYTVKEDFTVTTDNLYIYKDEIIASSLYGVYSFSKSTGKIVWSLLPESSTILTNSKILINKDTLYVSGKFKSNNKNTLYSYKLKDKSKLLEINLPKTIITNILQIQNNLIFGTGQSIVSREFFSINKNNFNIEWKLKQNIDFDSNIISNNDKGIFFKFKKKILELDLKKLVVKEKYILPYNYFKILGVYNNEIITYNNSSLITNSLSNNKIKVYKNIMTAGPWILNNEVYYVKDLSIKTFDNIH